MMLTHLDQHIRWLGLRLDVPGEWEVVRHSLGTLKGGLTFVDRRKQRLQVRWTACRKPPLIDKMLEDHTAHQLKQDPDADITPIRIGPWDGRVRDLGEDVQLTRVVMFDPQHSVMLEAMLSHYVEEQGMRDAVIESIDLAEPMDQPTQWRAFGVAIENPPDFQATAATINAGEATFKFQQVKAPGSDKPTPGRATLARMGMADGWFRGDLKKLLEAQNAKVDFDFIEVLLDMAQTGSAQRVTAVRATSTEPGPRIKRLAGRLRTRRDLIWHDADANAVFHIHTLSFEKTPVECDAFALRPAGEEAQPWR